MDTGKRMQGSLSAMLAAALLFLCLGISAAAAENWYPVDAADILPGETLLVTITHGGQTYLLTGVNGADRAPPALAAAPEAESLTGDFPDSGWTVEEREDLLILRPAGSENWLYSHNGNDGLRVGQGEAPEWSLREGTLYHEASRRYLRVDPESGIWQARKSPAQGQVLQFWSQRKPEPPETQPATEPAQSPAPEPSVPETTLPPQTLPEETLPGKTVPSETPPPTDSPYRHYFGQLHAHTAVSDGTGTPEEAFAHAAQVEGLDFFAVTDHSDSFDNADSGSLAVDGTTLSDAFAAGKGAARAASQEEFLGIHGFEMSWPQGMGLGHIVTLAAPGWQSWKQPAFSTLEAYYQALSQVSGAIGQFCHPGEDYGNFQNFAHYDSRWDSAMTLLEIGAEGGSRHYGAYTQALDAGWHVAPTTNHNDHRGHFGDAEESRTVVLAQSLTEESLFDALRSRRVYASDDRDLQITYFLSGRIMGTIAGSIPQPEARILAYDPTDPAVGHIDVIADGGTILASRRISENTGELTIPLEGGYSYYYLRITQDDGDIAVTAPVWTDSLRDLGIAAFCAEPQLPIQGHPLTLTAALFNDEAQDLTVDRLTFLADGEILSVLTDLGSLPGGSRRDFSQTYTHHGLGAVEFTVILEGRINGQHKSWTETLTLYYRAPEQTGDILIDLSHGNFGTASLNRLEEIAASGDMTVTPVTGALPAGGNLLLIHAPAVPFRPEFPEEVRSFLSGGGTVILCAQGEDSSRMNALLEAIGSTMSFGQRLPMTEMACLYQKEDPLTGNLLESQSFLLSGGCAVNPGESQPLVVHPETGDPLLAREQLPEGGQILAAGGAFLMDTFLPATVHPWQTPTGNMSILENLLGIQRPRLPESTILEAREGSCGDLFRVKGYVTTAFGYENQGFEDLLFLQDCTGGIGIVSLPEGSIPTGTALEVIGYRSQQSGNPVLELISITPAEEPAYRYTPQTIPCCRAMDYSRRGGELLQIQGRLLSAVSRPEGSGICQFTLVDENNDLATVVVEQDNRLAEDLKPGRTVRAAGILFRDEAGQSFLRVRDPREVVRVNPLTAIPDRSNPKTGDP